MIKWCFILWILLLTKVCTAQDTCRPKYDLPIQHLAVEGTSIAFVEKGTGDPIIFLHGLGGNLSHWQKNVQALSSTYHCIAIDLPGYGYSDKNFDTKGKDQLQYYADIILAFVKQKALKKVVLAGHSMGGQIAMIAAMQNDKFISKLILIAPAGLETFTEAEAKILINATPPSAFEKQEEAVIRHNFKQNFYEQPADAETLIQDRIRFKTCSDFKQYTEAVSNGVKGMLADPIKNDLSKITQPVLIIYGENDALIPNKYLHAQLKTEELIKDALSAIPKSKAVTIPKAGHLVQFEKPNETNKVIKEFLK